MKKVMIVDDEPVVQELLMVSLECGDYQILLAGDGLQALKLARAEHPDVIIMDIMMPYLNGLEVCRRLKADPVTAQSTIILLSGKNQSHDIEAGLLNGADDYVTKPFSPLALIEKITRALEQPKPAHETLPSLSRRSSAPRTLLSFQNTTP